MSLLDTLDYFIDDQEEHMECLIWDIREESNQEDPDPWYNQEFDRTKQRLEDLETIKNFMDNKRHPANDFEWDEIAEVEFNKWFHEDLYGPYSFRSEYFMGDVETEDIKQRKDAMISWLHSAFVTGVECGRYAELEVQQNQLGGTE